MPAKHRFANTRTQFVADRIGMAYPSDTRYIMWTCPNPTCSWFRVRTNTVKWDREVILHPRYGFVENYTAYIRDVERHDCEQTRLARIRHGINPAEFTYERYRGKGKDAA